MKIVICGNYGATNIGDDAILAGILNLIERHTKDAKVTVISSNPKNSHEIPRLPFGIRSFLKGGWGRTLKTIKECDLFILGGGGLFVDTKKKAPLIWGLHAFIAHLYKKPVYLFSNSIGPLNSSLGKWITRKTLEWSKIISFRDTQSIKLAQKLLPGKNYKFTPDPAFALKPTNTRGEGKIIISLRDWTKNMNKDIEKLPKIIDKIARDNRLGVLLVPFQAEGEEDSTLLNKIIEQCEAKEYVSLYKGPYTYKDTLNLFLGAKLIIGMRLHSMIFGAITGTPIIAINYSDKVKNFMSDMGLQSYTLNPEDLGLLPELTEKALKNAPSIKDKTEELRRLLYSSSLKLAL